ncbi:hypothetical protein BT96DRAFT_947038 [Gymnopus androsaceus JB14]|uniref:Uncharacterized protein n=1 Tax=Gymnopus androsaceus JB14 TaxID=1447944 RepID=A0A6A4GVX2_9AGAR|nr:hypothetical protein BT96DRAFT_947038 [Gymnopus androsaceus JB14]
MNKHRSNEHKVPTYSSRTYLDLFLTQSQDAKMSQVSVADASATSAVLSSNLLKGALTVFPSNGEQESICPKDELFSFGQFFLGSLNQYCSKKQKQLQPDKSWQKLLEEANPVKTETSTWNSYIGPILGFKLFNVLSGSSNVEGTIPRSVMSPPLRGAMNRIASFLTENQGWPKIFEDAIVARWNARTSSAPPPAPSTDTLSSSHSVPQTVAASVAKNLRNLSDTFRSKYHGNILNNIQLAASYLSIMSLGVIDIPMDEEFPAKLEECLRNAAFQSDDKFSDILTNLNLSLVAFQAPLFSSLAISPILLFRTCLLHSSRFGRHFYISFMLSLGDIKPASLREIETLIWKNLYLVARCQLSPQEMMDRVLDHIVEPQELESFKYDREKLRTYLNKKFDPIRDHTSFFHPDFGAIIKQELDPSFGRITTLSQKAVIPQPNPLFYDSSAALAQSGSSNLSPTTLRATGPVYDESGLRESGIGPAITASENSIVTGGVDLNSDGSSSVDRTHSDDAPISLTRDEVVGNASSPLSLPLPSPVHDAPGLDVSHIHEPMSSLPSGTPQPISAPTSSLTPRVSPSPGLDNNPPENFGPMSGLDSPSEDPRLLPDGNEIINPSGPEGAGGWNIPRATLVAMSGLNSPYEVPRLLPDSDEIANPSSLEGTGGWNIPQAIPVASLSQLDDSGGLDIPQHSLG